MLHRNNLVLAAAALFIAAVSTACANRNEPETTTTTTAAGTVDIPSDLQVDEVETGRMLGGDNNVVAEVEEFTTMDTIYAAVRTEGSATNAQLTARWMRDTTVVDEQTKTISPSAPMFTPFRLVPVSPWVPGDYKVVILLNGRIAEEEEFRVR